MEELIASQNELHGRISRTWENLKKSGQQNITVDLVRSSLMLLDNKWTRFEDQHASLMRNYRALLKGHEYVTRDLLTLAEEQYMSQRAQLLALERQLSGNATKATDQPATPSTAHAPSPSAQAQSYPRIDLPKFSSRFEDWPAFRDLFVSLVIEETALPEVRKLHYLKTSVQGEAASLLKNLPTTEENFKRAWATLQDHYENKRLLLRSYLNAFTALPKMRPNSISDLRQIFHGAMSTAGALEGVGRPIGSNEDLFVHLVVNLLDQNTRREWDKAIRKSAEPPSFLDLQRFLKEQVTSEEALAAPVPDAPLKAFPRSGRTVRVAQQGTGNVNPARACPVCGVSHFMATCTHYQKKTPQERKELVVMYNRCFNCLGRHSVTKCVVTKNCQKCAGRHHTSLHDAFSSVTPGANETSPQASVHNAGKPISEQAAVLLATARVWVKDAVGREHPIRALVDPGSETSLIAESLVQRIRLPRTPANVAIYGVGGHQSGVARGRVTLTLSAHDRGYALTISALILPRLSAYSVSVASDKGSWKHMEGLQLADPEFLARDSVEMLLGADAYATILLSGVRRGGSQEPVAQQTRLGWILLGGSSTGVSMPSATTLHCSLEEDVSSALRKFWEWEEPSPTTLPATPDEERCERLFLDTTKRLPDGKFQVRLPFRSQPPTELRFTKQAAARMLDSVHRRFSRDEEFHARYKEFMDEYLQLNHMSPVSQASPSETQLRCYLPHHGVLKTVVGTSKLRVVFNGSTRTSTGTSLNDNLLPGPNLLPLLPEVILRWRRHQFAFVADIEKMYRQIALHPEDRDYQGILWRHNGTIKEFRLNTVTYGTACAPFLAIRVLHQLATEECETHPAGAAALLNNSYVDDLLSGASSLAECQHLQGDLAALCMAGGFPLRKWAANHPDILQGVPPSHRQAPSSSADLPLDEHSVLGVRWNPSNDYLSVAVIDLPNTAPTKRKILSLVAKLFDPLGWLAPVVVVAKLIIQTTWLQQLDWDAPLAGKEAEMWERLVADLPAMESLRIPRWFTGLSRGCEIEVHGFADASERAYGAVIYLRIVHDDRISVSFVQAKTKVAPLKRVSLPRLELCGATLLCKLSSHVRKALNLTTTPTFHWLDSMIALAWIRGHPARWTTFVANRVAEIQRSSDAVRWRHVPGAENPADCASRGLMPAELTSHTIWWRGPPFLKLPSASWPSEEHPLPENDLPDRRSTQCVAVKQETSEPSELTRFSDLRRLLRVTAWILRWKSHTSAREKNTDAAEALTLSPQELEAALALWIRLTQRAAYFQEFEDIRAGRAVHGRSSIRKLTPFVDQQGILRVGGRLKHALLDVDQRHPVILFPESHLSRLIVEAHHRRTLHGGTQATLASIRQRFWLPRGRQLVKGVIHKCTKCIRWKAVSPHPLMGDLPLARVSPSRPFSHTGVDFAGPIRLRTAKGRGHRAYKGFLCIFICFSSRAVHLEVESDYSSMAFLAAFRRFSSRRGLCTAIYSDRGTNFIGVDAELRALFSKASSDARCIAGHLADRGVRWIFNPPAAPHFGGLWEAAVKSVKHHLRRVIGDHTLTYEDMATLLAEVEACLNSRPLQPLSDDPGDVAALTPGHFLVGAPLLAIPEPSLIDVHISRLTRWRMLQQMRDHLWARWSQEYIQTLLPRPKWGKGTGGLKEGQLCLIKDETSSPTRWPLARVVRLFEGRDCQVRVAEVKTATGTLSRPVVKLVPLLDPSSPSDSAP